MAETNKGLYKKRFATLKEHKAAVAARKALKAGKNKGPVANADAYGETLKKAKPKAKPVAKPTSTKAVRSASTSTNSSKTKVDPQRNTGSGRDGSFGSGTSGSGRPSDKNPKPKPTQRSETSKPVKTTRRTGLNSGHTPLPSFRNPFIGTREERLRINEQARKSAAERANKPNTNSKKTSGYKKGDTKTATIRGVKYVMTWNGSRWVSKKAKGKG